MGFDFGAYTKPITPSNVKWKGKGGVFWQERVGKEQKSEGQIHQKKTDNVGKSCRIYNPYAF